MCGPGVRSPFPPTALATGVPAGARGAPDEPPYRLGPHADVVAKTLVMVREGGAWKILDETSEAPQG